MEPQHRKIWPAATLLILAAAAAVFCLFRLSQPDRMQTSLLLNCTQTNRNGWTFETESGPVEPVFGFGGYLDGIPVDGDSPVAAERVMEDPGQRDLLQFLALARGYRCFWMVNCSTLTFRTKKTVRMPFWKMWISAAFPMTACASRFL